MSFVRSLFVAAALLIPNAASAELSANEALAAIDAGGERAEIIILFLDGNENGIGWMNTVAEQRGAPFFCPPRTETFSNEQLIQMLRVNSAQDQALGDAPLGLALYLSLLRTFPC